MKTDNSNLNLKIKLRLHHLPKKNNIKVLEAFAERFPDIF